MTRKQKWYGVAFLIAFVLFGFTIFIKLTGMGSWKSTDIMGIPASVICLMILYGKYRGWKDEW